MSSSFQQINIEELESVSFGDKDFKKELIEIFLDQIPTFIKNMNQFFDESKLILTGNPVRKDIENLNSKVDEACKKMLANQIMEHYSFSVSAC